MFLRVTLRGFFFFFLDSYCVWVFRGFPCCLLEYLYFQSAHSLQFSCVPSCFIDSFVGFLPVYRVLLRIDGFSVAEFSSFLLVPSFDSLRPLRISLLNVICPPAGSSSGGRLGGILVGFVWARRAPDLPHASAASHGSRSRSRSSSTSSHGY